MLSDARIERYSRQILLASVGGRGQEVLLSSRVAIVGDGPAAHTAALYLTTAGVGHIAMPSVRSEARSDGAALQGANPDCEVTCGPQQAGVSQSPDLLLAIDPRSSNAADEPETGAVRRLAAGAADGVATMIDLGRICGTCARALWPTLAPPTRPGAPLEGVAAAVAGSLLAQEALATLLHPHRPSGRRIRIDVGRAAATTELLSLPACPHQETAAA